MEFLLPQVFIVYISGLLARINPTTKELETDPKKYNNIFICIMMIYLICISGFRVGVGTDYWTYKEMYEIWAPTAAIEGSSDTGFLIFMKILHNFSMNSQLMFMVTSIIINVCIILTIKNYSQKFELSMLFYIITFIYYATFNGLRQSMSIAIAFAGTKYLLNRDWKKYFIIISFASLIHQSTLIMIPIYFIVNRKFKSKFNLYMCIGFLLALIFYNGFLDGLFSTLEGTNYGEYKEFVSVKGEGANILRFLVQFIPLGLIFIYGKEIIDDNDKDFNIILNLSLLGILFMMLALRHWIFARLTTIFNLYYLFVIPKVIDLGKDKKMKRLLCYVMTICYIAFTWLLLIRGESNILPYRYTFNLF